MKQVIIFNFYLFLAIFAILNIVAEPVYAYIDPGAGSNIIQSALAALLGVGAFIKRFWQKILKALGVGKNNHIKREE